MTRIELEQEAFKIARAEVLDEPDEEIMEMISKCSDNILICYVEEGIGD